MALIDRSVCLKCHLYIGDNGGYSCISCKLKIHVCCMGLSQEDKKLLEDPSRDMVYFCFRCERDTTQRYSCFDELRPKLLIISILMFLVVAGGIVGSVMLTKGVIDDEDSDQLPMNYTARLKTRGNWMSVDRTSVSELPVRPAKYVLVAHTAGYDCNVSLFCENVVKGLQRYSISQGTRDIVYNFLIGGDGYIYEGLGWGKYSSAAYGVNCASISVAFIGNYNDKKLRLSEINAYNLLVDEGVRIGEIETDYKLFAHSQVINTASPGLNIKSVIRSWKHWSEIKREDFICEKSNVTLNFKKKSSHSTK